MADDMGADDMGADDMADDMADDIGAEDEAPPAGADDDALDDDPAPATADEAADVALEAASAGLEEEHPASVSVRQALAATPRTRDRFIAFPFTFQDSASCRDAWRVLLREVLRRGGSGRCKQRR